MVDIPYPLSRFTRTPKPPEIEALENLLNYGEGKALDKVIQVLELDKFLHEGADLTTMGLFWEGRTPPECPQYVWANYQYHLKIKTDLLRDREMCLDRCNVKLHVDKVNGTSCRWRELLEPTNAYQAKYTAYVHTIEDNLQVEESKLAPWKHIVNQYRQRMSVRALLGQEPVPDIVPSAASVDPKLLQHLAAAGAAANANNGKKTKPPKRGRGKRPKNLFMKDDSASRIEEPPQEDGESEVTEETATGEP